MVVCDNTNRLVKKQDFVHVAILLTIAFGIGIYLIATTVLIAKDGVLYIEHAQKFSSDPIGIIKAHPPGYPFLILTAHKFVMLFTNSPSVFTWIYLTATFFTIPNIGLSFLPVKNTSAPTLKFNIQNTNPKVGAGRLPNPLDNIIL